MFKSVTGLSTFAQTEARTTSSCLLNQHSSTPQGSTSVNLHKMTVMALNICVVCALCTFSYFLVKFRQLSGNLLV